LMIDFNYEKIQDPKVGMSVMWLDLGSSLCDN